MTLSIDERFSRVNEGMKNFELNVHGKRSSMESALRRLNQLTEELVLLEGDEKNHLYAIEEFKRISNVRNENAKTVLENVLNWVLRNISLAQSYSARLEETNHGRNGKGLSIILIDNDTGFERNVEEQSGTALAQIISFLMTLISIKFSGASRIVVIDEVFSGIDDVDTVKMFGNILVALSENEGFQFIMVEHQEILDDIIGMNVVQLELNDYEKGTIVNEQFTKQDDDVEENTTIEQLEEFK